MYPWWEGVGSLPSTRRLPFRQHAGAESKYKELLLSSCRLHSTLLCGRQLLRERRLLASSCCSPDNAEEISSAPQRVYQLIPSHTRRGRERCVHVTTEHSKYQAVGKARAAFSLHSWHLFFFLWRSSVNRCFKRPLWSLSLICVVVQLGALVYFFWCEEKREGSVHPTLTPAADTQALCWTWSESQRECFYDLSGSTTVCTHVLANSLA